MATNNHNLGGLSTLEEYTFSQKSLTTPKGGEDALRKVTRERKGSGAVGGLGIEPQVSSKKEQLRTPEVKIVDINKIKSDISKKIKFKINQDMLGDQSKFSDLLEKQKKADYSLKLQKYDISEDTALNIAKQR